MEESFSLGSGVVESGSGPLLLRIDLIAFANYVTGADKKSGSA